MSMISTASGMLNRFLARLVSEVESIELEELGSLGHAISGLTQTQSLSVSYELLYERLYQKYTQNSKSQWSY